MRIGRWVKKKNDKGQWLRFGSLVRWLIDLGHYHTSARFLNLVLFRRNLLLGKWRRFDIDEDVLHRVFYVCESMEAESSRRIQKIPRGDNLFSHELILNLQAPGVFSRYEDLLMGLKNDEALGDHVVRVGEVRRDGGYGCEYVTGPNLAVIREQLLKGSLDQRTDPEVLAGAIETLKGALRSYANNNSGLIGDWALHNLVFSEQEKVLVNVDMEGFFTYQNPSVENNPSLIELALDDLVQLMRLYEDSSSEAGRVRGVLQLLNKVRANTSSYNGLLFSVGYHSLDIGGHYFRGQRECSERLKQVPYDFSDKTVVDFGCNSGGMLHALADQVKYGVGIDYDRNAINAAKAVSRVNETGHLEFFVADLDEDLSDTSYINSLLQKEEMDICFLLSVCMWLQNWKRLVRQASLVSRSMLFESNGSDEQQREQLAELHAIYNSVVPVSDTAEDDPLQSVRALFLCSDKK